MPANGGKAQNPKPCQEGLRFDLSIFIIHIVYHVKHIFASRPYTFPMGRTPVKGSALSRNLKRIRKEQGLSQYDLAEMCGLSQRMIHHYETYATIPPLEKLKALAAALKVKVADLLDDPSDNEALDASLFDTRSLKKLRDILELPPNDRSFLYRTLSNLVRKNQLERASRARGTQLSESR